MQSTQQQKASLSWLPFGPDAFARAKQEQKPVFLHIGFPSCHWCHVMEQESFQNADIIEILVESFICIHVDREERPDVDAIYMAACQTMTGTGGWPLTALLTPSQQPFYITTYLPPMELFRLLTDVQLQWAQKKEPYASLGEQITESLKSLYRPPSTAVPLELRLLNNAVRAYSSSFDRDFGGTGIAPKFPMPQSLTFLLRYGMLSLDTRAVEMAETTLLRMAEGSIFDHVAGGFMRYATDRRWVAPHFEKMLGDNALLVNAYLEAWQITGRSIFHDVAVRTLDFVLREMTDVEGGFYASLDADAKGVEGAYYFINQRELESVLGKNDAEAYAKYYSLEPSQLPNRIGHGGGISTQRMTMLSEAVDAYRKSRMPLRRDEKLLTAWNGLMIGAMANGYRLTGDMRYLDAARAALACVRKRLKRPDGRLYISSRDGKPTGEGLLEDYAFLAEGCLCLYRATLDDRALRFAVELSRTMLDQFEDRNTGGFYMTPHGGEKLLVRPRETADSAQPSGNAAALSVLMTLSSMDIGEGWSEAAQRQTRLQVSAAYDAPLQHMASLTAVLPLLYPTALLDVRADAAGRSLVLNALTDLYRPLLYIKASAPGKSGTSYRLCKGKTCLPPMHHIEEVLEAL